MDGVYAWIRDGVRRAVILGFSDAVEQLGIPEQDEKVHPKLAAVLGDVTPALSASGGGTRKGRKRLGRSLEEISSSQKQSA